MQTLRQIVVGTDFSECAEYAVDAALRLARLSLARVTVVHVCVLAAERGIPEALLTPALDDELLQSCREALAATVARRRGGVEVTGVLRSGRPWEKLGNVAAEVGANLIVVGRHGAGRGAGELGSVAERLLRAATRPVLAVPCELSRARFVEVG